MDFIGDFYNDRPVYHSGVLKTLKVPVKEPTSVASQLGNLKGISFKGFASKN
jgi:hypothetical protein